MISHHCLRSMTQVPPTSDCGPAGALLSARASTSVLRLRLLLRLRFFSFFFSCSHCAACVFLDHRTGWCNPFNSHRTDPPGLQQVLNALSSAWVGYTFQYFRTDPPGSVQIGRERESSDRGNTEMIKLVLSTYNVMLSLWLRNRQGALLLCSSQISAECLNRSSSLPFL